MMVTMYGQWYAHIHKCMGVCRYTLTALLWIKTYLRNCSLSSLNKGASIISGCPVTSTWGFLVDPVSVTTSPNVGWQTVATCIGGLESEDSQGWYSYFMDSS